MPHTQAINATTPSASTISNSHTLTDLRPPENVSGPSGTWEGGEDHEHGAADGQAVRFPTRSTMLSVPPSPRAVQALRPRHSRTRSATAPISSPADLYASTLRARANSTTEHPTGVHRSSPMRTVSLSESLLHPVTPVLSLATETEETIGSFSPTSCPRQHLHHILGDAKAGRSRFHSLRVAVPSLRAKLPFDRDLPAYDKHRSTATSDSDSDNATSPTSISSIPSICRTPSTYSESEYFSTAPSSAGPVTPVHSRPSSPKMSHKNLRPILEALEDASRFRVKTACASCRKAGSNFPCCPRCGEMWCSRECRVRSTGGKRHVCGGRGQTSSRTSVIEVAHR